VAVTFPDLRCMPRVGKTVRGYGGAMPRKPQIIVEPRPDGRWAVQKDGTTRASRLFPRQQDAEARARAQATREGAELLVKGRDGTVQRRDSHGADDPAKKG
jgi:hypothetical protein